MSDIIWEAKPINIKIYAHHNDDGVYYKIKGLTTNNSYGNLSVEVAALFSVIGKKYATRNGGYTRIVKIGLRKGDAAMEVLLELV